MTSRVNSRLLLRLFQLNIATTTDYDIMLQCKSNRNSRCGYSGRLHVGIYYIYLKDWIERFGKNQVMVVRLEDPDLEATMINVYDFLHIGESDQNESDRKHMIMYDNDKII